MDRETDLVHLAQAAKAIAHAQRHIADQEQRVRELDRHGHNTTQAHALLALYRVVQAQHVARRNLILKELQLDDGR
jgi:hypothetical protein